MFWYDLLKKIMDRPPAIKPFVIIANKQPTATSQIIPQCGIDLIKLRENCKLEAYLDENKIPTIAYGHTQGVKIGDTCTQFQADQWLAIDCDWAWKTVLKDVRVPLTENQAGALLSFVYNLGQTRFEKQGINLLAILNSGNYAGVPGKFRQFVWETGKDGSRKISQGLVNRRKAEVDLWNGQSAWNPSVNA